MQPPATVPLTRLRAHVCVALVWAAIYLPGLGSLEIKGEEGRRLLPAVSMLETGRWIVPSIGGVDYLSKPPLINWLAAAAFAVAGDTHSEWAARAPSVLAVLALGLCTVGALGGWLGEGGALLAAVFLLTNIGLMEKGRLAEIEALYLSLTGIAVVLWLGAWRRDVLTRGGRPSWRTWTLPWLFLGLGLLAKGPLHLVFFYATVAAVLGCAGRRRDWLNGPHGVGVALALAIFAAWAVPYLRQTAAGGAGGVWLAQFQGRLEVNERFHLGTWLLNIPRGLANYLPWTVLLPLAWRRGPVPTDPGSPEQMLDAAIARGLRWAVGGCFLAVSLAPGGQPRYTLPLLTSASVLVALVLTPGWRPPAWLPVVWARTNAVCLGVVMCAAPLAIAFGGHRPWQWTVGLAVAGIAMALLQRVCRWPQTSALALMSAAAMALITAVYVVGAIPLLRKTESVRPAAEAIDLAVEESRVAPFPGRGPVAVLRPGFLPFLFYLRRAPDYLQNADAVPWYTLYLLVRQEDEAEATESLRRAGRTPKAILRVADKRVREAGKNQWVLLRITPAPEGSL